MSKNCIFILGGARGGKSQFAQELARKLSDRVLFVATAEAGDEEMCSRIEAHKKARPKMWGTLETPIKLAEKISEHIGKADVVIIDCITMLISNLLTGQGDDGANEKRMRTEIDRLIECIDRMDVTFIIISNEVGMGLVSDNRLGRLYRDLLGRANQLLAQRADEVYLIVVGIPVEIKVH